MLLGTCKKCGHIRIMATDIISICPRCGEDTFIPVVDDHANGPIPATCKTCGRIYLLGESGKCDSCGTIDYIQTLDGILLVTMCCDVCGEIYSEQIDLPHACPSCDSMFYRQITGGQDDTTSNNQSQMEDPSDQYDEDN